jgi:endonuclease/exonuclease/phosphatase family metal-dependent hydrolase
MASAATEIRREHTELCWGWSREDLGETCALLALHLCIPFHHSSEVFLHSFFTAVPEGFETLEKVKRVFLVIIHALLLPLTCVAAVAGGCVEILANALTQKNYTYWHGNAAEKNSQNCSVLTLNTCMFWGGIPLIAGGTQPARYRTEQLADLIREQNADVIALQEVSFGPACDLFEHLKDDYAHFFTRIGSNPFRMESGLFIASKIPVIAEPQFFPFEGQSGIRRGVFCLEFPHYFVLNTHLESGSSQESIRMRHEQLHFITTLIQDFKARTNKPCFLAGDLNVNRKGLNDEYSQSLIPTHFQDPYAARFPNPYEEVATCTNVLSSSLTRTIHEGERWELDDYILLDSESRHKYQLDIQLISAFSLIRPLAALSDHHALLVHAQFIEEEQT